MTLDYSAIFDNICRILSKNGTNYVYHKNESYLTFQIPNSDKFNSLMSEIREETKSITDRDNSLRIRRCGPKCTLNLIL